MYRVLVTDSLSAAGLQLLKETEGIEVDVRSDLAKDPEKLREALKEADGILIRSATRLTPEVLKDQKRLKVIVRAGVGVDNIDLPAATREGIVVMNTPAGNTISTAEHALAMMMGLARNIAPADATMKQSKWDKKSFTGTQLAGKTLGVVGLGRVGQTVAKRALALEMRVIGFDPFLTPERAAEQNIEFTRDLDKLVTECDFLTVHTTLSDETRGMINAERMSKMKKGVRLINCARGGIIDEADLLAALESGQVGGAALDVFVDEPPKEWKLAQHPKVLATPHLGASTEEAQESVALEAAELIIGYLVRKEARHAINMAPISGAEMKEMANYLNLGYRLGLLLAQLNKSGGVHGATISYRGEVSAKNTKLITSCFTAGLLESAFDETVNMVNADLVATSRGLQITESHTNKAGDFASMITATLNTEMGDLTASGTVFGYGYLRLVRLGNYALDAFLDGNLLIYRHIDRPGQIGRIGDVLGRHNVNIGNMSLGRKSDKPGGNSVAILHLDQPPTAEVVQEISNHPDVRGVDVVILPSAGASLPWLSTPEMK